MSVTTTAVELGRISAPDPLRLSARIRKPQDQSRKTKKFYASQNETIVNLLKPVDQHYSDAADREASNALRVQIAVKGSLIANLLLAVLQVYGAVSSGSLSLFTTMADSLFDPLSNILLYVAHRQAANLDRRRFPSGKARLETVGNIVFSAMMASVSLILIAVSAIQLVSAGGQGGRETLHIPSVVAVSVAFTTKLILFLYCFALRNQYSQIRILWQDHRNDLFINGFGLMTSVLGSKVASWIDPSGAIVLSSIILIVWLRTAYVEFGLLIGIAAPPSFIQLITYISISHSDEIKAIDTVYAYHSGPRLIVEVDIVVDENMTVKVSHNLAEELQMKIEGLADVERAYVHIDFETSHFPEHSKKLV